MSAQEQTQNSSLDKLKWLMAIAAMAGAVYANHILVDDSVLIRAAAVIALVVIGLALAAVTEKGRAAIEFAKEARIEARKVVWPTRTETVQTSLIIAFSVAVMSLFLWLLDAGLVKLIGLVTFGD